jgi:hypothetical protein
LDTYPLTTQQITSWFHSKKPELKSLGVVLAGVHEGSGTIKPSAFADFDTDSAMGRIIIWVSGEVELHVLRRSDGKDALIRYENAPTLNTPSLDDGFNDFVRCMTSPQVDSF